MSYTAISIKIVSKQSGKVEYEREWIAENRWKINIWFFNDSQPAFRARIRLSLPSASHASHASFASLVNFDQMYTVHGHRGAS
jgi:hypothetical protein